VILTACLEKTKWSVFDSIEMNLRGIKVSTKKKTFRTKMKTVNRKNGATTFITTTLVLTTFSISWAYDFPLCHC
jgi:hypothetical protein